MPLPLAVAESRGRLRTSDRAEVNLPVGVDAHPFRLGSATRNVTSKRVNSPVSIVFPDPQRGRKQHRRALQTPPEPAQFSRLLEGVIGGG
jgi:hypothetical protein